jgi:hypothetical protein
MSPLQCGFCSRSNPADAKFCNSCGGQLNLAPCPHCEGVNEVTASVCHACKGALVESTVERGFGGSEYAGSGPEHSGIDTRLDEPASEFADSTGAIGSSRETHVSTEGAVASHVESSMAGSTRQAPTDVLEPYRAYFTRDADPPPEHATFAVDGYAAVPAENAVVPLRAAPALRRRNAASFIRRTIVTAVGVGLLIAVGVLLYGPSLSPVHPTPPAVGAAPAEAAASTESGTPAERTVTVQGEPPNASQPVEPAPRRASVQSSFAGAAAATVSGSAAACSDGVAALGLCSSASGQAQPAARVRSSSDGARRLAKDDATGGCKDAAAAALGLCASITTTGKD